ncbi:LOW QUALITY PROTEIN: transmembrane 4 L6 family member 4-like [Notothenia coriiceps]|uniref:LOW QUALITY PROTEIN: transmembrane 4 L6 family member 4-like n=1 Tax=Notothenia coriiceps TaxID=8208 RepID=A0A6I9NNP5_9TELE|nr:PREDICTED: LOW QUALITY PROTEIN: transmembrane 4 L6 family member 4-like [Notothenia coriiceps]
MCSGSFSKCLGISLMPLAIVCVLCNILLFFPGGKPVEKEHITEQVWYFGGILGSGVLMIFPALVFLGSAKTMTCCGCCGNESWRAEFAMLSSILFAAVGVAGAGYSVIVSAVAINEGPQCVVKYNETVPIWDTPFSNGDYLSNNTIWLKCVEPPGVVPWHLSLFSVLLVMGLIQMALCAVQVVNGLLACLCGDCCGGSDAV